MNGRRQSSFIFDLDGTLVDSVYQHVLAWREALETEGIELSVWRIHRKIGMSGGLFANMLLRETGMDLTVERIGRLQRLHAQAYSRVSAQIRPLPGARALLSTLSDAGIPWAIATSGRMETARPVMWAESRKSVKGTPILLCWFLLTFFTQLFAVDMQLLWLCVLFTAESLVLGPLLFLLHTHNHQRVNQSINNQSLNQSINK